MEGFLLNGRDNFEELRQYQTSDNFDFEKHTF